MKVSKIKLGFLKEEPTVLREVEEIDSLNGYICFHGDDNWYPIESFVEMTLKEELQSQKFLESFTPSGSEFYNNPRRCADFIKQRFDFFKNKFKNNEKIFN